MGAARKERDIEAKRQQTETLNRKALPNKEIYRIIEGKGGKMEVMAGVEPALTILQTAA